MRFQSLRDRLLLLALASVLCPGAARAVDGVVEINQAGALKGGITPGDAPGFPVTITVSGSYRLTSNLNVGSNPNLNAIDITTSDVSLDLNGFAIVGPVSCGPAQTLASCAPAGSGIGINGAFMSRVRHGTVRGFGGDGILVFSDSQISDLLVISNGGPGIATGSTISGLLVEDSRAIQNGGFGISAGIDSIVQRCVAEWNGSGGISTSFRSLVVGNVASQNGVIGIQALSGSAIQHNVASNNQASGITTGNGSLVSHNSAFQNGGEGIAVGQGTLASDNAASYNGSNGIDTGTGSSVQRNTAAHNGGDGLYLFVLSGHPPGYLENVMDGNGATTGGVPVIGGVNMGANYCDGAICP